MASLRFSLAPRQVCGRARQTSDADEHGPLPGLTPAGTVNLICKTPTGQSSAIGDNSVLFMIESNAQR
jgi:hypothetical protein